MFGLEVGAIILIGLLIAAAAATVYSTFAAYRNSVNANSRQEPVQSGVPAKSILTSINHFFSSLFKKKEEVLTPQPVQNRVNPASVKRYSDKVKESFDQGIPLFVSLSNEQNPQIPQNKLHRTMSCHF